MNGFRLLFFVAMIAWIAFFSYYAMASGRASTLVLAPLFISPFAMLVIRMGYEFGKPAGIFNPQTQSWAFLFGDTIFIPIALLGGYMVQYDAMNRADRRFLRDSWFWASLLSGYGLATFWNLVLDSPNYVRAGHGDLLFSPSHLWHGWVVFPVLSAALIYYGLPIIFQRRRGKWAIVFCVGLAGYLAMSVADGTIHPLDVTNLHPPVSQTWLSDTK